jgi:signal transduction histidine kinase
VPEYRQQAVIDIMIAMGKKESQHFEFTLRRKDGTTFPASVFLNPVSRGGKVTGMAGIVINLSEQKKLEQLKDDFIGMVSHELRTPLTSIIGSVNMVRGAGSRLTARDVRQLLDDAASSAEDLSDTLTNLLELSRVKAERLILHPEMVNIKTILRSVAKKFRSRSADHRFVLNLPKGNIVIAADPLRLEHILHNLLENAIKYSPRGGSINISLEQDKDEYVFGITDSGIGISIVNQQKLFAPFQRLEDIKTAGIGLGLLVCRRLVEAHHGRIWVDSKPGKGSTFYFTIPVKRS